MTTPLVFAPAATRPLRRASGRGARRAPGAVEEREFEGGEHKSRPLVSVRGREVFVVQSLSGDESAAQTTGFAGCCSSLPA